jgi:branched-chain amino acid transport system ATP-binding protein
MTEPLLKLSGLESGYGDVQVLWGIDLEVREGEVVSIVGSNGAGKSTMLRTISGLVKARAGSIVFDGKDITQAKSDAVVGMGIAHVPEGRLLFRGLTVRDNLLIGGYLRTDPQEVLADIERVYDIFPILRERQDQDATTLSGGEQQMCAFGRGLIARPRLLMIDEFSLGLAPQAIERLGEAIVEINKSGVTVLLVEQDVITAFELASHAFVIETGHVSMSGKTKELADNPKVREAYMGI